MIRNLKNKSEAIILKLKKLKKVVHRDESYSWSTVDRKSRANGLTLTLVSLWKLLSENVLNNKIIQTKRKKSLPTP